MNPKSKDRDDQKFDKPYYLAFGGAIVFWVIVGLVVALVMCMVSNKAEAGESFVGHSLAKAHTKTQWVPFDGTVDFRQASENIYALSVGHRFSPSRHLDVSAAVTLFSPFTQSMIGHDSGGRVDNRYVTTNTAVVGLTLEPKMGPVFMRYGAGLGLFYQDLRYQRSGEFRRKKEFQTGMVGITGVGFRSGRWSASYDLYTNIVFRNSDLGGFNQRRERRHVSAITLNYDWRF